MTGWRTTTASVRVRVWGKVAAARQSSDSCAACALQRQTTTTWGMTLRTRTTSRRSQPAACHGVCRSDLLQGSALSSHARAPHWPPVSCHRGDRALATAREVLSQPPCVHATPVVDRRRRPPAAWRAKLDAGANVQLRMELMSRAIVEFGSQCRHVSPLPRTHTNGPSITPPGSLVCWRCTPSVSTPRTPASSCASTSRPTGARADERADGTLPAAVTPSSPTPQVRLPRCGRAQRVLRRL